MRTVHYQLPAVALAERCIKPSPRCMNPSYILVVR